MMPFANIVRLDDNSLPVCTFYYVPHHARAPSLLQRFVVVVVAAAG